MINKNRQYLWDDIPKMINKVTSDFVATIQIDALNKRLKLLDYKAENFMNLTNFLIKTANQNKLDKIIIYGKENDWKHFLNIGFTLETIHPYYFCGKPLYYLAKFLTKERVKRDHIRQKNEIIAVASIKGRYKNHTLPRNFTLRPATSQDITGLIKLYQEVFESYPTPIYEKEYLTKSMENDNFFMVITNEKNKIVSALSADIDKNNLCAEITDCATLPEYRINKLMYHLVMEIEKEMKKINLVSLYTIARAISPGINTVFSRNDYKYCGRFIKNCHICGDYEDMNLWVKKTYTS